MHVNWVKTGLAIFIVGSAVTSLYLYEIRFLLMEDYEKANVLFDGSLDYQGDLENNVGFNGQKEAKNNYSADFHVKNGISYWVGVNPDVRELAAFRISSRQVGLGNNSEIYLYSEKVVQPNWGPRKLLDTLVGEDVDRINCNKKAGREICRFDEFRTFYMVSGQIDTAQNNEKIDFIIQGCAHRGEGCEIS